MAKISLPPLSAADLPYQGRLLAGVDEAGRGPLVGSVVAGAVILDPERPIVGLMDSKQLSEKKRLLLADEIRTKSLAWAVAEASAEEIDQLNILHASLLAMQRALDALGTPAEFVLVDGNRLPKTLKQPGLAIVKGDARHPAISAASILAKVTRDAQLLELHQRHPQYGFASHKGYPTKAHFEALERHGLLPEYRKTFGPVRKLLSPDKG